MFSAEDHVFMARALALTANGRDTATPNPNVGCVIARGGRILGEGWHARAGEAHAEAHALAHCQESPEGATAYVTLEPCSHHGRTPPCADALIAARLARVVYAVDDPNPKVAGQGGARLRAAGITVATGLMAAQATEAHLGYLTRQRVGRPWMRLKSAASLDGRIALANGESQWISSEASRRDVHALRARSCAMLTGIGTVLRDDPELTVRHVPCERQPRRVIIDSRLDISPTARILQGEPVTLFTVNTDSPKRKALEAAGVQILMAPVDPGKPGKTDLAAIARVLGEQGFNEVTVETGAKLNGALLAAAVIDEIVLYVAPKIFGDTGQGLYGLPEFTRLDQVLEPRLHEVRQVGPDLRLTLRFS